MLTPDFSKAEDRERYDDFMGKLVDLVLDKYDGSLKAEHGTGVNMAPYVEREWGDEGDRADVAGQAAGRSRRRAGAGRGAQPRPRRPPQEPADQPARSRTRRRQPLRRVRLLRAGLPEPLADDDAAPADRAAARDGAPARRLAGPARARRAVRVRRRSRPAPRTAPARSPARSGSTPASWSRTSAGARTRPRAERMAVRAARHWAAVERAARAGLRAGGGVGRPLMRGVDALARAAVGDELVPAWPDNMPHPAPAELPATDARRRGRRLPAGLRQPDLRPRARRRRRPEPARGAGRGVGARRAAALDPARRRRQLLRRAVELEGLRRRATRRWSNAPLEAMWRWSDGGELPIVTDASSCALGLGQEIAEALDGARTPSATRSSRSSTRSRGPTTGCCPSSSVERRLGRGRRASDLLGAPPRAGAEARRDRVPSSPTRSSIPPSATCCGMAGDRGLLHPELPRRRPPTPRPSSTGAASTPTCARTAPARSASSRGRGEPTSRSSSRSRPRRARSRGTAYKPARGCERFRSPSSAGPRCW